MTNQELEYLRICTQSHKRDLARAVRVISYDDVANDAANEFVIRLLDKIDRGIDMMYATLEAEVTTTTDTSEVTPND